MNIDFKNKVIFFIGFLMTHFISFSQIGINFSETEQKSEQKSEKNADKLANYYLEQKDYEKANKYFEELYLEVPAKWYFSYFKSLVAANDLLKAEKITKKQLKSEKNDVYLYVYLGKVYQLQKDTKREKEMYEKAIKELTPIEPYISDLVNAFKQNQLFDFAILTFDKAIKFSDGYPYFYERAEIFKEMNNFQAMINEYLDALEYRESEILTVKIHLQNSLGYDDEAGGIKNPLLKKELQRRIIKSPDKIILVEFLIFIQKLQKDFEGAFIQTKALDKRFNEEGFRIYELAQICVENKKWDIAKKCYAYIADKGQATVYFNNAIIEGLNVEYLSLTEQKIPNQDSLILLEQKLEKSNALFNDFFLNASILKNLVTIKAFYLNKTQQAILLIEDFIIKKEIATPLKAEFKIILADIYLIKGEIWEASLLYSQVEKDFKYEAIGQEAKFKNAKLSFYAGDFEWAKIQVDVLKGATTKLISNDALDLSLIITDAIGIDTNYMPLKLFSSAELMILQHKYLQAIVRMDSINLLFSKHTLGDDIYFKKAQIYMLQGNYIAAEEMYKNILKYYPTELYGDDAQFKLSELYEQILKNNEKAKQAYQDLLINYPGSIFTVESRKKYRELRGDTISN